MEKIYNLAIVLSFLGLWVTSYVPNQYEVVLGFILIFSFGILHGSNDILLIENISNRKTKRPFFKVLAIYLLTVFSAVILFYFIPVLALILFIIFSAFHFGEQHWENKIVYPSKLINQFYYLVYGFFVLTLLFIFNANEVIEVIKSITNYSIINSFIIKAFIISSFCFTCFLIFFALKAEKLKAIILSELFYLLVFAIIFKVSSLIWGFAIYFILWHSIPSLFEQINFIYGSFKKEHIISYLKKAFPYWLISLVGLGIISFLFIEDKLFYAILFSFIAAVTFPHSLVINKMFKHKKTQSNK